MTEDRMRELCQTYFGLVSLDEREAYVKQHPELLSTEVDAYLDRLASRQKSDGARDLFQNARQLLSQCRTVGISNAFSAYKQGLPSETPEEKLVPAVHAFIRAGSLDKMRTVVEAHPELLTPEADALMQKTSDERTKQAFIPFRYLLARCKEVGIAQAFSEAQEDA
jgi:hypothetical protein